MVLIIHCILLFFVEVIKLGMVMIGLMEFKLRRQFIFYLSGGVFVLGIVSIYTLYRNENAQLYNSTYIYNIITLLVVTILVLGTSGKMKVLITIINYAAISLVDVVLTGILFIFFKISADIVMKKIIWDLLANSISIIFIFILILIKLKINGNLTKSFFAIRPRYLILVLFGIIGCGWYIAPIQVLGISQQQSSIQKLIALGVSISGIVFIMTCVGLVITNDSKNHYRTLSDINQRLIEQQKVYYQTLIEKDQYTRRFRHDISNHIYCMQHLCEQERFIELSMYLHDMQDNIKELNIDIQTGNDIVNIIVNDIYNKNRNENIKVKWKGILPPNLKITSMDLCTIFSNLLINAIEAVKKMGISETHIIEVNIKSLLNSIVIQITNPVQEKVMIENKRLKTTKKNKENHGLGSINVEQCIKKYEGDLKYWSTEKSFTAELIFSDIIIE